MKSAMPTLPGNVGMQFYEWSRSERTIHVTQVVTAILEWIGGVFLSSEPQSTFWLTISLSSSSKR